MSTLRLVARAPEGALGVLACPPEGVPRRLAQTRRALTRAGIVLWLAACVWCSATRLEAQEVAAPNIALRAGATCLDEAWLRRELAQWLAQPVRAASLQIDVQGSVDDPRSVLVRLYTAGKEVAQRDFSPGPASCADLHGAVALAIALMLKVADGAPDAAALGPRAAEAARPPSLPSPEQPSPDARRTARTAREETNASSSSPTTVSASPFALSLRASGLFAVGARRFAAGGFRSELAVSVARAFELRAGLLGLFSLAHGLANSDGTFTTRALAGTVGACARLVHRSHFQLRMCAEFWAGRMRADGANFDPRLAAHLPWSNAAVQLELGFPLSTDWALTLLGAPVVNLRRTLIVARDEHDVIATSAELPRVSAVVGIGLAYSLSRSPER